jgi:ABC-type phosphate transport system ATPase subunit
MFLGQVIEQGPTLDIFLTPKRKETEMYVEGRYG